MENRTPPRGTGKRNQVLKPSRIMTTHRQKTGKCWKNGENSIVTRNQTKHTGKGKAAGQHNMGHSLHGKPRTESSVNFKD